MNQQILHRKPYDTDTEIMRILAALFVVMIHVSGTASFSAIFYNSIARFSVPVFVLISGYYMLARESSGWQLARKSLRLFLLMLVWSSFYYIYDLLFNGKTFSGVGDLFTYLLTEPVHLWYLYAAILLYLFTPLLHILLAHASRQTLCYILGLFFVFGSVVAMLLRSESFPLLAVIVDKMKAPYMLGFFFLYLLGGYWRKYGPPKKAHRQVLYLLGLAGAVVTVSGVWMMSLHGLSEDFFLSFFSPNALAMGMAFFVFVQQAFRSLPSPSNNLRIWIHTFAGCTLGIYLLHPMIAATLQRIAAFSAAPALAIPETTLAAFLLSALLIFVLKKLPALRHLA